MKEVDKKDMQDSIPKQIPSSEIAITAPGIPKKVETRIDYFAGRVQMYKFQKDFVDSMQKYLGFPIKSAFMRYAIITFCKDQKKIYDVQQEADEEFKIAYKKWRKKFLIEKMKIKEKIAKLRAMAPPQDQGDFAFSEEELMN